MPEKMKKLYLKLLRDYFAAKAMAAIVPIQMRNLDDFENQGDLKAKMAYRMADRMLRARNAKNS